MNSRTRGDPYENLGPANALREAAVCAGGLHSPGGLPYLGAGMSTQTAMRSGLLDARGWRGIGGLLAAGLLTALWMQQQQRFGRFSYDDTFITLRYAENLARHGQLSFNLAPRDAPIDGYTSPAWTVLLAAALRIGIDGERAALALSWLCGLLGIWGSGVLARRLGASWVAALAVACLGTATTVGWVVWSAPGMETPFVGACATALLIAYTGGEPGSRWRAGLLLGTAAARPECAVLVGIGLVGDAYLLRQKPGALGQAGRRRIAAVFLTLLLAFAAHWIYYGAPLPNTYYAKLSGIAVWRIGLKDLWEFLTTHGVGLGLVAALGLLWAGWGVPRLPILAFLGWSGATFCAYAAAGGDYLEHHRFYQPLVPAAFAMLAALLRIPRGTRLPGRGARGAVLVLTAALGVFFVVSGRRALATAWTGYLPGATIHTRRCRQAALALARFYPPGTSMSIRAAGIIPYLTRFRCFDTLGLNTREVALHPGTIHPENRGHVKEASAAQIVAWQPDLIVNHPSFRGDDESGVLPADTPPEYRVAGYAFRCIPVGDGTWLCVYEHPRLHHRAQPPDGSSPEQTEKSS